MFFKILSKTDCKSCSHFLWYHQTITIWLSMWCLCNYWAYISWDGPSSTFGVGLGWVGIGNKTSGIFGFFLGIFMDGLFWHSLQQLFMYNPMICSACSIHTNHFFLLWKFSHIVLVSFPMESLFCSLAPIFVCTVDSFPQCNWSWLTYFVYVIPFISACKTWQWCSIKSAGRKFSTRSNKLKVSFQLY